MMMMIVWVFALVPAAAIDLRVSTVAGSRYLDKRLDVEVDSDTTVGDLKGILEKEFPGNPPRSLQRLFAGSQHLADDDAGIEGELIFLDMVPPISSTGRAPDDTAERVRAYVAEVVALEYSFRLLRGGPANDDDDDEMRCAHLVDDLRDLERALLDDTLAADLDRQERAVVSGAVRTGLDGARRIPPWHETLAVTLNVHWRETAKVVLALVAAAKFGANDSFRKLVFASMVPAVLLAQTRHVRFVAKMLWYALPTIPDNSFFSAFFGAPQQLMLSLNANDYYDLLYRPAAPVRKPVFKTRFFALLPTSDLDHPRDLVVSHDDDDDDEVPNLDEDDDDEGDFEADEYEEDEEDYDEEDDAEYDEEEEDDDDEDYDDDEEEEDEEDDDDDEYEEDDDEEYDEEDDEDEDDV